MRKVTTKYSGTSWLLATSLAATLAAFGCSSNRFAGNGQPTSVMPTINSVNHSGTPGSSSGTEGIPPMSSSSAPRVNFDALAILAAEQGYRGRVLGPVNPGGYQQGVTISSGQFVSPANAVYPQSTVNSSINSGPTEVITGGNVGAGINIAATPTGMTSDPMTATTAGVTNGMSATTGALTSTGAGTTVAGSATFSPVLMNSTPAPQSTGSVATTKTAAASTARSTTSSSKTTSRMTTASTNVNVASGIQIQNNPNGAIVVTNVAKAAPAVKGK